MTEPPAADDAATDATDPLTTVRTYHQLTKHGPRRFAPGPGHLDWQTQPDPFRRYRDTQLIPLPLVDGPDDRAFADVDRPGEVAAQILDATTLGLFLELGLGLTAWKQINDVQWSLRANPSSGNLHPTEGYVWLPGLSDIGSTAGFYHYAPREHALEMRCTTEATDWPGSGGTFLLGLSSIPWRESWKYGERAFRYCQHDCGHAMASLRYAAAVLGWSLRWLAEPTDAELAKLLGLDRPLDMVDGEPELPECLAVVDCTGGDEAFDWRQVLLWAEAASWQGQARRLSVAQVDWEQLDAVAAAAEKRQGVTADLSLAQITAPKIPPTEPTPGIAEIIRRRRSAVDMDGATAISDQSFFRMLGRTVPDPATMPWDSFPFLPRVALFIFVHRVEGLPPGLYALLRNPAWRDELGTLCNSAFVWESVGPERLPLYRLQGGDFIGRAAHLSCTQEIAGDGAFSLGMVAQFDAALDEDGASAYRRLFWECGLVGQVLYLEAEAAGVQATGIGCFFDDVMHETLGLAGEDMAWQSLYHFTVGAGVEDDRLTTLPAYHHLPAERQPTPV